MDNKEFKKKFDEIANSNGFEHAFGGWFKNSNECIAVLDLQKSNFGNYYQLNIKIFIQGIFGKNYVNNKDLVKKEIGNILSGEPQNYRSVFDFDLSMPDDMRIQKLKLLFQEYIVPFTSKALSKAGIKELVDTNQISLFSAVRKELGF